MSEQTGKRIGLTGGMGAGKSTVSAYLRALGAIVLDADAASRKAVEPGTEGLKLLVARYGAGILMSDGALDRPALAKIIFASDSERLAVNAILHPMVRSILLQEEQEVRRQAPEAVVFWDVPLLIESGMHADMDAVWLVEADEETRIRRIMKRDRCSRLDALSRIQRQMPDEEKRAFATQRIDNSSEEGALFAQVDALYAAL